MPLIYKRSSLLLGPMLETLDYTIRIGSIPTFLYFDLYLYSTYAAHFVYNLFPHCAQEFWRNLLTQQECQKLIHMQKWDMVCKSENMVLSDGSRVTLTICVSRG